MTIGCPECGTLEDIPPLQARMSARCVVCSTTLEVTGGRTEGAALACALATFVLLLPANLAPLMTAHVLGLDRTTLLGSGVIAMWTRGYVIVALLMGVFGIILPLLRFGGLTLALGLVQSPLRPRWLGRLYRWVMWADLWAMPDVFLVGFGIGYERVAQRLDAQVGAGGYCFIAAALMTMITRATLDRRRIWRSIAPERDAPPGPAISCTVCDLSMPRSAESQPCPRCGLKLRTRKPDAVVRAAALTLAALVLYVPANVYPMTTASELGRDTPHRIINGVVELFQAGLWPFGIIIFTFSIVVPLVKLFGMGWFVYSVKTGSTKHLKAKTRLYRVIDELGRWSFMDVFTLVIFVPLIQFDGLASAHPEPGAPAFALVVFLTMTASRMFDPRLMWDAAEGKLR